MGKTLFAAIVGLPNVGKSTLLNRLIGTKIAITSGKPQTTRNRIMGVLTEGENQYVFLDTPGVHRPRNKLGEHMLRSITETLDGVDVVLFVVFPKWELNDAEKALLERIAKQNTPIVLVVNKIDLLSSTENQAAMVEALQSDGVFSAAIGVSALTGQGTDQLLTLLSAYGQEGPFYFEEDTLTDQPERVIVAELFREKLLTHLSEELPHGTAVVIDRFAEEEDSVEIHLTVIAEKRSHKGMIIGKGGRMLKRIKADARGDIESFLGRPVHLHCWVKIKEDWRNREGDVREIVKG